ncbi:MAG TPA: nucleotidyltransferase family protein [Thermoanaerobaculia bacterium]|jgi:molybdenum cofactor cytidylyltransferase|nr:nucleotidyltransferase family protein [Thermoanaerobaculia bacterium]
MAIALLPAAGASRRMGRPKLLLPFGTSTVIGSLVASFRTAEIERIIVVAAPGDLPLHDWVRRTGLTLAINPDPERGMLSSVVAGLAALGGTEALTARHEALLISPADLPTLQPETIRATLAALSIPGIALAWPTYRGKNGHPLGIAAEAVAGISTLDPAIGLKQLRDRFSGHTIEISVDDPGAVADVDTPEEYARVSSGE